jgi:hypothetical protein
VKTGPEHYQRAEQLLEGRDGAGRQWQDAGWYGLPSDAERAAYRDKQLAEAAVHMGLAQAAASALRASIRVNAAGAMIGWPGFGDDLDEWHQVAGGSGKRKEQ